MLVMAGEPVPMPIFLVFWVGMAALGMFFLFYMKLIKPDIAPLQLIGLGLGVLPLSMGLPYLILRRRVGSRQKKIIQALPSSGGSGRPPTVSRLRR